jgi:CheY-like chemotaxis protein
MSLTVLIVEDDPDGAATVDMMLRSVGMQTHVVDSAEAALSILENGKHFDGAVVDLALPVMDGFELMTTLRRHPTHHNLRLVAVTAYHTPELKVKALDSGFNAYFAKPLDTNLFAQALEQILV